MFTSKTIKPGDKYNDWEVIEFDKKVKTQKSKRYYWKCLCICGKEKSVIGVHLRSGNSKNCGCKSKELFRKRTGNKNPNWKGDNAGYKAIHQWVHRHTTKPKACDICKKIKSLDLANISQKYYRNLSDWEWLCRKCHSNKYANLKGIKKNKSIRKCISCGILKKIHAKNVCQICYDRLVVELKK